MVGDELRPGRPPAHHAAGVCAVPGPVAVVICGTNGTGKSTIASLLASRLGVPHVLATDAVRHMLATLAGDPVLQASTYEVHRALTFPEGTSHEKRVVRGYKAQSALVMPGVVGALRRVAARHESVVVEGIHLRPRTLLAMTAELEGMGMTVVPFLVHVPDAAKHRDRFSVRARHMSLDEDRNRYVKFFGHIRIVQDYLLRAAAKHAVPVIKNTSTDRSLALIHATVQRCLSTPGSLQSGVAHGCFDRVLKCFLECAGALCGERKAQQMAMRYSSVKGGSAGSSRSAEGPGSDGAGGRDGAGSDDWPPGPLRVPDGCEGLSGVASLGMQGDGVDLADGQPTAETAAQGDAEPRLWWAAGADPGTPSAGSAAGRALSAASGSTVPVGVGMGRDDGQDCGASSGEEGAEWCHCGEGVVGAWGADVGALEGESGAALVERGGSEAATCWPGTLTRCSRCWGLRRDVCGDDEWDASDGECSVGPGDDAVALV